MSEYKQEQSQENKVDQLLIDLGKIHHSAHTEAQDKQLSEPAYTTAYNEHVHNKFAPLIDAFIKSAKTNTEFLSQTTTTYLNQNILDVAMADLESFKKIVDLLMQKENAEIFRTLIMQQDGNGDNVLHQLIKFNRIAQLTHFMQKILESKDQGLIDLMAQALLQKNEPTLATEWTNAIPAQNLFEIKDGLGQNILDFAMQDNKNFKYLCDFLIQKNMIADLVRLITEKDTSENPVTVLHQAIEFKRPGTINYLFTLAAHKQEIETALIEVLTADQEIDATYIINSVRNIDTLTFLKEKIFIAENNKTLIDERIKKEKEILDPIKNQINAMINTLKSESGTMSFGWNTDLKAKKIKGLAALEKDIILADTADEIKDLIIKQLSDPTMTQGRFSHRTRDLLEKLLVESHPRDEENHDLNIFKDKYGARIASMIAKLETEGASLIKSDKKQGLMGLLNALKGAASLDDASSAIDQALNAPGTTTQGFFSHRTKDLLQQMRQDIDALQSSPSLTNK